MKHDIETIMLKTICPDCGGREMCLGYTYGDGSLHKKTKVLGMTGYTQGSNLVHILCKNCGLLIKSYATDIQKL
jgi:hypothetical protein